MSKTGGLTLVHIVLKLADAAARKAAGLTYDLEGLPSSIRELFEEIIPIIAQQIAVDDGSTLRCRICGKGPFTRKGLYLHLRRVHIDFIQDLVKKELEEYLWRVKTFKS